MSLSARRRAVAIGLVVATLGAIGCAYWTVDGRGGPSQEAAAVVGLVVCAIALAVLGFWLGRLEREEHRRR